MNASNWQTHFRTRRVLITGGMGFIGSNLAIQLVNQGAQVTIADAMIPGYGGNLFNIEPIRQQVTVNFCDIRDVNTMNYLVQGQDYIFHLAGQVDHILSLSDPYPDIDMNIKGTAVVMEACKHHNPKARVIYTGTRGQYGSAVSLPVDENAPTHPKGIYEITRLTAEKITQVYHEVHGIRSVMLRLTNVYGPRAQMIHARYGVVNWFARLAIDGAAIQVFGDGQIKRDFLYVDDCIEAMLMAAVCSDAYGEVFNVGLDQPTTFLELAQTMIEVAGTGTWAFAPFSPERKAQEPGDFYSDISKIKRIVGWQPRTSLAVGLAQTIAYYRAHKAHYW
ncbi:MAG: GDP-mannose 4,6-dehydratase [Anaerolinea sp.]|nr:GDP-mannose 4,6-dehydratase [Anaerolinea sp.]MCC6973976.1 GDP-mannose 4,6-dehydratase [Anaerolineae bacterium]